MSFFFEPTRACGFDGLKGNVKEIQLVLVFLESPDATRCIEWFAESGCGCGVRAAHEFCLHHASQLAPNERLAMRLCKLPFEALMAFMGNKKPPETIEESTA